MYDAESYLVPNPLNRYALGDRSPLRYDDDGSLTLYIQHESPGADKEANWLPAPEGAIFLALRLYWPKPSRCRRDLESAGGGKGGVTEDRSGKEDAWGTVP